MKITKLTAQVKNKDRVNVFIDGVYEFSLTLNELLEYKLKVGKELDNSEISLLKKVSANGKLKTQTIDWLLRRPHSEKELTSYLKKKNIDSHEISDIVELMQLRKYQNNQTFTYWWIEQRLASNKSKKYITQELLGKGIKRQDIEDVFSQFNFTEEDQIKKLVNKKNLLKKYPDHQKLIGYLLRQGFGYDSIKSFMNR